MLLGCQGYYAQHRVVSKRAFAQPLPGWSGDGVSSIERLLKLRRALLRTSVPEHGSLKYLRLPSPS